MTGVRVLVVEDDPGVAFLLVDSLRFDGFDVEHASDGIEALATLSTWVPDVMLMDLGLPRMDGWELRRRQRELPEPLCAVPVVVLTGAHLPGGVGALEAAAVFRKPFELEELVTTLAAFASSTGALAEEREGEARQGGTNAGTT